MRSLLSPITANIFMEDFETRASDTAKYKPKLCLKYVQLQGMAKTLLSRSQRLADADHIQTKRSEIKHILRINGFTTYTINRAFHARTKSIDTTTYVTKAYLTYIKSTTDKIGRTLLKRQIQTIFSTNRKIGQILNNPKYKIPLEAQEVYEIPYRVCNLSYVGQTKRKISVRGEEHKLAVRTKQTTSALAQHLQMTGHKIE
ncbi:hypothetical protein Trydic_g7913 [Trypoxylus dichotomus]